MGCEQSARIEIVETPEQGKQQKGYTNSKVAIVLWLYAWLI
jgi:hypothetical protein